MTRNATHAANVCGIGKWTVAAGTTRNDTKCQACSKGTFRAIAPTSSKAEIESEVCDPHHTCTAGEWIQTEGTNKSDTQCKACSSGRFRASAPKGKAKEIETEVCKAHRACKVGQWTTAVGTKSKDTICTDCPTGTARATAPAGASTVETVATCKACVDRSMYSDDSGLEQCKKCPSGHFGVTTAGSNAGGGHTACDDDTCERPTKLPANSVLVDSKCPEHGKQKKTSGTVISQNASTCTLSCKDGFYSSGVIKSFTCLADNELTTASYQGGTITCTGECVSVIDVACDAMFSLLCFANGYESITVLVAFDNYIVCCERGNVWILCQCKKLHCAHLLSMQPTSFAVSANGQ